MVSVGPPQRSPSTLCTLKDNGMRFVCDYGWVINIMSLVVNVWTQPINHTPGIFRIVNTMPSFRIFVERVPLK